MNRTQINDFLHENLEYEPESFVPGQTYIPSTRKYIDRDDILSLINSGLDAWFTEGRYAIEFDKDLRTFFHNTIRHSLLVNSGSSANLLAVTTITDKAFGERQAKAGDEVITVACGFPTTLNPIVQNGLVPVFVDVDMDTLLPDMEVIENAIVKGKTKAVILAHPLGNPFAADVLRDICDEYGIWMVEDACDALGGSLFGRPVGSFGDLATLSFYPAHHITAGEGGAVLIQSPMANKVARSFRDWGKDCWCEPGRDNTCGKRFGYCVAGLPDGYDHKYTFSRIGYNLKATDMQASLLVSQIKKLPWFIEQRKKNWNALRAGLNKYRRYLRFQSAIEGADPSWFGFMISVKESAPFTRKELINYLEQHKIGTRLVFGGNLLKQPAYQHIQCKVFQELTGTDVVMRYAFWIGVHPSITPEMIEYILKVFDKFMQEHK